MHKIAVIGGDGTGPEVTVEAEKVLAAAAKSCGFTYESIRFDFGGDRYLRTGEVLPASAVEEMRAFDAILLGAIGHPATWRRALPALRLRLHPRPQPHEDAHTRRQDERADVRLRSLGAHLPRGRRRRLSGHQARLRARRRDVHVDGEEPGVVRRHR